LLPVAAGILRHMNDDHADALLDYCRAFGGFEPTSAELVGVDRYGMDVLATSIDRDRRAVRIPFSERTDTTDAVRQQTIALLRAARAQLAP
jgi:putative heme iron utilization protein